MLERDLCDRLIEHFRCIARAALDVGASDEEITFEARVLYGQFFGWTPARNSTLH